MIFFTNETGYLYAIYGLNGGLADSPWPMIHQNPKHNCRLDEYYVSCDENNIIPENYFLKNYPNPFNPSTTISFELTTELTSLRNASAWQAENTEIIIFNLKGQKVRTLVNEKLDAGTHQVVWNGNDNEGKSVSSGVYLYKMNAGRYTSTKKMILMK